MSVRPKARSPEHGPQPGGPEVHEEFEELEELGDEAIIAQQTAAHALQPRANVAEESRSVVITEPPPERHDVPPRNPPRSSAEATLVIRDRRALDEMRQKIVRRQQRKAAQGRRALYLWGALGLAAFVLGGIVAFLATEAHSDSQAADDLTPPARDEARTPLTSPQHGPLASPVAPSGSLKSPPAVRLDELPVERKR